MRVSGWSSEGCSSDLLGRGGEVGPDEAPPLLEVGGIAEMDHVVVDRLPGHDQLVPARRLDRPLAVDAVAAPGAPEQRAGRADALFGGILLARPHLDLGHPRSEERRVGTESVSTVSSGGWPDP